MFDHDFSWYFFFWVWNARFVKDCYNVSLFFCSNFVSYRVICCQYTWLALHSDGYGTVRFLLLLFGKRVEFIGGIEFRLYFHSLFFTYDCWWCQLRLWSNRKNIIVIISMNQPHCRWKELERKATKKKEETKHETNCQIKFNDNRHTQLYWSRKKKTELGTQMAWEKVFVLRQKWSTNKGSSNK